MDQFQDLVNMAANEFYVTDSDSDDSDAYGEAGVEDDKASNCSVYGSTTSNEGDTLEEYEDLDEEDQASNDQAQDVQFQEDLEQQVEGEHNHAQRILQVGNVLPFAEEHDNEVNDVDLNGYVNHEHDYAHDGQRDGVVVEVYSDNVSMESKPEPDLAVGQYASNCVVKSSECVKVKIMRNEDCPPQSIGAEITVRTDKTSDAQLPSQDHFPNMSSLSDDLLLEIFSNLDLNSLINIAPVCKRWYELSKHKSLWLNAAVSCYDAKELRIIRAARYLHTVDVRKVKASNHVLSALLSGPECVRKFCCFTVVHPRVVVELLQRYKDCLQDLTISISDERLSYGEGGSFKDGVKPRPGYLLKLISEMENLRCLRFTGSLPSSASHQGRVNPKWYFGELESPQLKLEAIAMKIENPREILLQKFIIPFLRSKIPFLRELHLTIDLYRNKEVIEIVRNCDKLKALVEFPIDSIHVLENCKQQFFIDLILESSTDFQKVENNILGLQGLSHIHEISLRFCGNPQQLPRANEEVIPDTRLETFLQVLAGRLKSCKRIHIYRFFYATFVSSCALAKFLFALRHTLEEVHICDRSGQNLPQLMKAIRESVPLLKSRGIIMNCLGNQGLLFSVHRKADSIISNTGLLSCWNVV